MNATRPTAVAGTFYPRDANVLRATVDELLRAASAHLDPDEPAPKALVVPHAGYIYSGPIAASAYARLLPHAARYQRVVLLGPAHRVYVRGIAAAGAKVFETPLGPVPVDVAHLSRASHVVTRTDAHALEHSLEVQLPFLARVLPGVPVVPLLVGDATPAEVGETLASLWGGPETLIVISSDLSHYLSYDDARRVDSKTAGRIVHLAVPIEGEEACGAAPLNGLLHEARRLGLHGSLLDLRNSGDTQGPRDEVVGYGAFAFYEQEARSDRAPRR